MSGISQFIGFHSCFKKKYLANVLGEFRKIVDDEKTEY